MKNQSEIIEKLTEILIHVGLPGEYKPGYNLIKALSKSECLQCKVFANELQSLQDEPEEQEDIYLITEKNDDGTLKGCKPSIQVKAYWIHEGYKYTAHKTDGAITLCKWPIQDIGEHCCYSEDIIKQPEEQGVKKRVCPSCGKDNIFSVIQEHHKCRDCGIRFCTDMDGEPKSYATLDAQFHSETGIRSELIKFNLNDYIYIQINDNGWDHLKKTVGDDYIEHCIENHKVEIKNETWYKLQCHSVFDIFPMNYGGESLINTNIMFEFFSKK
jgi:hypothetical protein